jgi:hypothetical protein
MIPLMLVTVFSNPQDVGTACRLRERSDWPESGRCAAGCSQFRTIPRSSICFWIGLGFNLAGFEEWTRRVEREERGVGREGR